MSGWVVNSGGLGATQQVVATMPLLDPSACAANQTFIPPGHAFTAGNQTGQITPTGACQDTVASPSAFSISSLFESGTQGGDAPLGIPIGFWLAGAAGLALLFWRH